MVCASRIRRASLPTAAGRPPPPRIPPQRTPMASPASRSPMIPCPTKNEASPLLWSALRTPTTLFVALLSLVAGCRQILDINEREYRPANDGGSDANVDDDASIGAKLMPEGAAPVVEAGVGQCG